MGSKLLNQGIKGLTFITQLLVSIVLGSTMSTTGSDRTKFFIQDILTPRNVQHVKYVKKSFFRALRGHFLDHTIKENGGKAENTMLKRHGVDDIAEKLKKTYLEWYKYVI